MFGFIKEIEGVEFPEALRILADRAGVALERYDAKEKDRTSRLYDAAELAAKFFEKQLAHSTNGKKALEYLKDRGLTDATIQEWRLGFAPDDWHALGTFLSDSGYSEREIIDAGLAVPKDGRSYDRFRSRITFPIADINGRVVGFTARAFTLPGKEPEKEGAKYINTPQTAIYDKSRVLFGLNRAKLDVKRQDKCLLVEGNMDAIMSHQAGATHAVATSGTALTPTQLRLLQRYTVNLDFCFDTDQAGALATRRGIGLALSQGFAIGVVEMNDKDCKDPADYVQKYGEKWKEVSAKAKPVIEFYVDQVRSVYDPRSAASKKSVIGVLAPLINRLASKVERSHWVSHLAAFLRVSEDDVRDDIKTAKDDLAVYEEHGPAAKAQSAATPAPVAEPGPDVLQEALVSLVMKNAAMFADDLRHIDGRYLHPKVLNVFELVRRSGTDNVQFGELLKQERPAPGQEGSYALEFAYLRSQELWKDFSDEELRTEFIGLLDKIKAKAITVQLAGLEFDIKEAEISRDDKKLSDLVSKFTSLAQELAHIHKA